VQLGSATYVVVDTETTGLRAEWDRVIEVAAVKVRGGEVVDSFSQLVNPGRAIPGRITHITGITTAMVYDQPSMDEVMPRFLEFLGEDVFVAHNLPFDHRFLSAELGRCSLPPLENPGVCTLRLARRLLPALPSRGLGALGAHFGLSNRARHRALGDAEVTAGVLLRLLDRLSANFGIATVADLVAFQHKRYATTSGEPRHIRKIREEVLPELPDRPGVYIFKRRNGEVLYVGKAKSLANRVRSYFSAVDSHPVRIRRLVRDLREVEWEETGSELAALLRESRLIKTLHPRDNRAQTAYRDYPFIRLDATHQYPRLSVARGIAADGAEYYGPISRRVVAEEVVELANQHFGLRSCDDAALRTATAQQRACLYKEIEQCVAPCVAEDGGAYGTELTRVRRLLGGDASELLDVLQQKMHVAAERLDFEQARFIRDQMERLRRITAGQRPFGRPIHDVHGVLLEDDARGGMQAFILRCGRLVERVEMHASENGSRSDTLSEALTRQLDPDLTSARIFERAEVDEIKILTHWLRCDGVDSRLLSWEPGMPVDELMARLPWESPAASRA
jgi:DNA polymerase III subunit epsilon